MCRGGVNTRRLVVRHSILRLVLRGRELAFRLRRRARFTRQEKVGKVSHRFSCSGNGRLLVK